MSRPRAFFQRQITDWLLEDAAGRQRVVPVRLAGFKKRQNVTWQDFPWRPGERAIAARLSCRHWYRLKRLWSPTTKAKGPSRRHRGPTTSGRPCAECGAGDRRQAQDHRAREILRDAVRRAAEDVVLFPHLVDFVWDALRSVRAPFAPKSEAQDAIFTDIDSHARKARLTEPRQDEEDEDCARAEEPPASCPTPKHGHSLARAVSPETP